jgi:hypothetical protein
VAGKERRGGRGWAPRVRERGGRGWGAAGPLGPIGPVSVRVSGFFSFLFKNINKYIFI